jgi:hypothetical protein
MWGENQRMSPNPAVAKKQPLAHPSAHPKVEAFDHDYL